jgi:hypothetical protein
VAVFTNNVKNFIPEAIFTNSVKEASTNLFLMYYPEAVFTNAEDASRSIFIFYPEAFFTKNEEYILFTSSIYYAKNLKPISSLRAAEAAFTAAKWEDLFCDNFLM